MNQHRKPSWLKRTWWVVIDFLEGKPVQAWYVMATVIVGLGVLATFFVPNPNDRPEPSPTVTVKVTETVSPTPSPKASHTVPAGGYLSCEDAKAASALPLKRGDTGYRASLDQDGDGTACEGA